MITVTQKVIEAGDEFGGNALKASVAKAFDGDGGSQTFADWEKKDVPNRDLILAYINGELGFSAASYIAMQRAANGRPGENWKVLDVDA